MEANSQTVAACLSVRLVLRAAKATTTYGKNLVAGNIVRQLSKFNLEYTVVPAQKEMDWVGFEPTTSVHLGIR
jgi:hypothetical protein